ncbi:MAG: AraC family transcriptional regulator [Pseudoruegeria sp.]
MIESLDVGLDQLLLRKLLNTPLLDIIEATAGTLKVDYQIVIVDCRKHFSDLKNVFLPHHSSSHSRIALIDPVPNNRRNIFEMGFADFLSLPVLAPELHVRLIGQCLALSLRDQKFLYSPVALVERCCTHLADHIAQSVSVDLLVKMFNTNHNTLTTMFKQEMGLPPIAWQRMKRLEGAAHQLRATNRPITTIAADFGYDLPGNFSTAFRRHFGMTPNKYRKNERRKS